MRAVRTLTFLVAALAALVWAGSALAIIVPQKSIAGIALDMTGAQVRAVAGPPDSINRGTNDFGKFTVFRYRKLKVFFQQVIDPNKQTVIGVFTTRRRQETAEGIHVGSTETALRTAYPGAHCRTEDPTFRHCWTGRMKPGFRVTDYRIGILSGRVKSVTVARFLD